MTKILIDEATVKLVLEALEDLQRQYAVYPNSFWDWSKGRNAITALKEMAKQPAKQPAQQEPVAWTELLREARDNRKASIVEEGISASRKEYRIDLEARLTAALNTSPQPAQQEFVSPGGGYVPAIPAQQALDKKAENAKDLGLDYEPLAETQVSKVWWDGERLMAKPIPFVEFYKPAQRTWVGLTLTDRESLRARFADCNYPAILVDVIGDIFKEKNT